MNTVNIDQTKFGLETIDQYVKFFNCVLAVYDEIRDIFMKDVYYWSGLTFISLILFVIFNEHIQV